MDLINVCSKIVFETCAGQQIGHNLNETQRNCETL